MAKRNGLEKFLERIYPKHGKLQIDEKGNIHTIIVDAETDGFLCKFNNDDCVEINTEGYSYITLDRSTLIQLAKLIEKADKIYENRTEEEWDKYENQK